MPSGRVGILHPGQMGSVVAAAAQSQGNDVYWASQGRSRASAQRAAELNLKDANTVPELCATCDVIATVCPPEFADATADQVLSFGFRGMFIDANAIAPERIRAMDRRMTAAGVCFVDAGIIGLATMVPGKVWMLFSGCDAAQAAQFFSGGPIQTEVLDDKAGSASALKLCYSAYNKGSIALLCATMATAESLGVREALERQWARSAGGSASGSKPDPYRALPQSAAKAWRFAPEMLEIAGTFEAAGMPPEFHRGAAAVYEMLREFKDVPNLQIETILQALLGQAMEKKA
jgi:3-hydroxyisobutyrate dehydrogenase-like beta-hydroxyacid dehydrogenase